MNISSVLRLESRTNETNFEKKSMSFYTTLDSLQFLMGQKEVLLVHVNNKTEESRTVVVSGAKLFNSLEVRTYNRRPVVVYRY